LGVLLIHLSTNSDEFSRYNVGWNGTSQFFDSLDRQKVIEIEDPHELIGYTNTSLLIISPYRNFSSQDLDCYYTYVAQGNTLILADNFGTGTKLLSGIGSSMRILNGTLSSMDRAYNNQYMIIAYPANPIRMPLGDAGIVFNKAAPVSGGDPLITTSPLSWIDTKSNRGSGYGISFTTYTVVAHEALGRGDIFVVGDPNIFINSMQNIESGNANAQFINLLLRSHEMILVDTYSTRIEQPAGLWTIIHRIQTNIEYRLGFATLILLVILITWQKIVI
jgi:hypothetical protein